MRKQTISGSNFVAGTSLLLCLLLLMAAFGAENKQNESVNNEQPKSTQNQQQAKQLEFELKEASVFELGDELRSDFVRGQYAQCQEQRFGPVKTYPVFKSNKPLYGLVHFFGKPAGSKNEFYFAIDESAGTGKGYETLYFDRNADLDLTNDTKLMADSNPPSGALLKYSSIKQQVCFDKLNITFNFGPDGTRSIEVMPRLIIFEDNRPQFSFFATKVRTGEVDISVGKYDAVLGYSHSVGGQLDQAVTTFFLVQRGDKSPPRWLGGDTLQAMHCIGGKYYHFASTPSGDKLFVRPYDGALGTFEVGAGGRDVKQFSMYGSLRSENTAVAVGGELENGLPKLAQTCQVPVGDYLPSYIMLQFGGISIGVSDNYHSDGKPGVRAGKQVYGIKIQEDKPYIFDLSNKPEVLFASPAKDKRIKLGEKLLVKAVLIDPKLDIMIRRLNDITRKQKIMSLDPKVVVTRANDGEKIAEGVMPFG
jgi:hypothetical protein